MKTMFLRAGGRAVLLLLALPAVTPMSAAELRIALAGQALITSDLRARPYPGFDSLAGLLSQADVRFTNLEVSIDAPGAGQPTKSGLYFHTGKPEVLDCLQAFSFNLLALSNNHAFDLGPEGILTTLREVDQRGFTRAGSGNRLDEAARPAFLATPNGKVALVSMASKVNQDSIARGDRPGVNHLQVGQNSGDIDPGDSERILAAIRAAAAEADVVIVYQHNHYWEPDNRNTPEWQRRWARQCVDAGASVFVNHGVPLLHGIEAYRGAPIFYCLGNFIFHSRTPPGHYPAEVWQSVVADLHFKDGQWRALTLHPVCLTEAADGDALVPERGRPRPADAAEAEAILMRLDKLSRPYGTRLKFTPDGKATLKAASSAE